MDGFSYHNIFETKGIEYIVIILFLVLLIPFWLWLNKESKITKQIKSSLAGFSFALFNLPRGIFHSRNHTWAYLEKSGEAKIGLDEFVVRITGDLQVKHLKKEGDIIERGELISEIFKDKRSLKIYSPLSGIITRTNPNLEETNQLVVENVYNKGWIYSIKPRNWKEETESLFLMEETVEWSKKELQHFKDFLAASAKQISPEGTELVLQDGGELINNPLSEFPEEIWNNFQKEFLE